MKVFIQHYPQNIPYGGGNQFVLFFIEFLKKNNIEITFELDDNIDIIFVINPFSGPLRKYGINDFIEYRKKNTHVKIVLRVNENDARKNTNHMDKMMCYAIKNSDQVIYISTWLKNYYQKMFLVKHNVPECVIDMACNSKIFYPVKNKTFSGRKIRIVTHHNSDNWMKGFDIYQEIDTWISNSLDAKNKYEFIYIGNLNKDFVKSSTYNVPKTTIETCAEVLRQCDVYVTATRNEPGGNHHVEAASCGLPILYHKDSGGVTDLCKNWGEEFYDFQDFLIKLEKLIENYNDYREKIDYDYLSEKRCSDEYLKAFNDL